MGKRRRTKKEKTHYRVYRTVYDDWVTPRPDGWPVAFLSVDAAGKARWKICSWEFLRVAKEHFDEPLERGPGGSLIRHTPYSPEALAYIQKWALPAKGFMLVEMSPEKH